LEATAVSWRSAVADCWLPPATVARPPLAYLLAKGFKASPITGVGRREVVQPAVPTPALAS